MDSAPTLPHFPDELYTDLAIGTSPFDDTCWLHGIDPDVIRPWENDPGFIYKLLSAKQAVEDDGRAFRARCRSIVQKNVAQMEDIIRDREITAGHRIDAFRTLAKLGELEPKESSVLGGGVGLSLTIIAPGGQRVEVMAQTPIEGQVESGDSQPESGVLALEEWDWAELAVG